jgi:NAD(P)H-dependent FMN reductase
MSIIVISSSLSEKSKSRKLANYAASRLEALSVPFELVDLRDFPLPLCDAGDAYSHPNVAVLHQKIAEADAILLAAPVYTYSLGSASKNLIELTGKAWLEKPVGFLLSAGGRSSYMSVLGTANSLMLDYRCPIVPRFVYADPEVFAEDGSIQAEICQRIDHLTETLNHWSKVL